MERPLPDAGGVLDQNDELIWAFGHIDVFYAEEAEMKKNLEENQAKFAEMRKALLAGATVTR